MIEGLKRLVESKKTEASKTLALGTEEEVEDVLDQGDIELHNVVGASNKNRSTDSVAFKESARLIECLRGSSNKGQEGALSIDRALSGLVNLTNAASNCSTAGLSSLGDAVPPLLELLRQKVTDQQKQMACSLLARLAFDESNRSQIARQGGIAPVVALVSTGTDRQKAWAATVLANMAYNSASNRSAIREQGAIPPLVALLTGNSSTPQQKQYGARALAQLAFEDPNNCEEIARRSDPAACCARGARHRTPAAKWRGCACAVGRSTSTHADITRARGIPALIALVQNGSTELEKQHAALALAKLSACTQRCSDESMPAAEIARAGGISALVALLVQSSAIDQQKQQQYAASAIASLSLHCKRVRQDVLRSQGTIGALMSMAKDGTEAQRDEAVCAIANLVIDGAGAQIIASVGAIVPVLVAMVTSGTPRQRENAARALGNLACDDMLRALIVKEGAIGALVSLVGDGKAPSEQRGWAAVALGRLAHKSPTNRKAIVDHDGRIVEKIEQLVSSSPDSSTDKLNALSPELAGRVRSTLSAFDQSGKSRSPFKVPGCLRLLRERAGALTLPNIPQGALNTLVAMLCAARSGIIMSRMGVVAGESSTSHPPASS